MNKFLLNAVTILSGSAAVFFANIQAALIGQSQSISYDYLVLASFFFGLITFRDNHLSQDRRPPFFWLSTLITLVVMTMSLMLLGIWRLVDPMRIDIQQFSFLAIGVFLLSVFQLLSRDIPADVYRAVIRTDYAFYGGLSHTLVYSLPAGILTFVIFKVTDYPATMSNHASVFAAMLALVLLFRDGFGRKRQSGK